MRTSEWTSIGFQSANPRTDFRGGGILSLCNLVFFAENSQKYMQEMMAHYKQREDFFIAIASINLTSYLTSYLYMSNAEMVPRSHLRLRAGRSHFKTFCDLNAQDKKSFFHLHSLAFRYLFNMWRKQTEFGVSSLSGGKKLPPNFNTIIDLTIDAVHLVLGKDDIDSLSSLIFAFEAEIIALKVPPLVLDP